MFDRAIVHYSQAYLTDHLNERPGVSNRRRARSSELTGALFRPSFTKLANITRMYTMIQTPAGKFLLEDDAGRENVRSLARSFESLT